MPSRDEELDQLDKELKQGLRGQPTPAIDPGENAPIGDGTSCFLNMDRRCDADCRAFNPTTNGESPDSCTIIAGVTDIATNLERLLGVAGLLKKTAQDRARAQDEKPPPDPRGGSRTG